MKNRKDQQAVYQRLRERLRRDKARTNILPISPLGLMEMTRQRAKESLASVHYLNCPYCHGHGTVKSPTTMSVELQRALHSIVRRHADSVHEIKIIVHPDLLSRLRTEDEELLLDIERHYAVRLSFRTDPNFHHERFTILDAMTNEEMKP